jgi:hypothetical protein
MMDGPFYKIDLEIISKKRGVLRHLTINKLLSIRTYVCLINIYIL